MNRVLLLFWFGIMLTYLGIFLAIFDVEFFYIPAGTGLALCAFSFCEKE